MDQPFPPVGPHLSAQHNIRGINEGLKEARKLIALTWLALAGVVAANYLLLVPLGVFEVPYLGPVIAAACATQVLYTIWMTTRMSKLMLRMLRMRNHLANQAAMKKTQS